jgi:hypothetical protein
MRNLSNFFFNNKKFFFILFLFFIIPLVNQHYFLGATDYVWGVLPSEIDFFYGKNSKTIFMDTWEAENLGQNIISEGYLPIYSLDRIVYFFFSKEFFFIINNFILLIKIIIIYFFSLKIQKEINFKKNIRELVSLIYCFCGGTIYYLQFQSALSQFLFFTISVYYILRLYKNYEILKLFKLVIFLFLFVSHGLLDDAFNLMLLLFYISLIFFFITKRKIEVIKFYFFCLPAVLFLFSNLSAYYFESQIELGLNDEKLSIVSLDIHKIFSNFATIQSLPKLFIPSFLGFSDGFSRVIYNSDHHSHSMFPYYYYSSFLFILLISFIKKINSLNFYLIIIFFFIILQGFVHSVWKIFFYANYSYYIYLSSLILFLLPLQKKNFNSSFIFFIKYKNYFNYFFKLLLLLIFFLVFINFYYAKNFAVKNYYSYKNLFLVDALNINFLNYSLFVFCVFILLFINLKFNKLNFFFYTIFILFYFIKTFLTGFKYFDLIPLLLITYIFFIDYFYNHRNFYKKSLYKKIYNLLIISFVLIFFLHFNRSFNYQSFNKFDVYANIFFIFSGIYIFFLIIKFYINLKKINIFHFRTSVFILKNIFFIEIIFYTFVMLNLVGNPYYKISNYFNGNHILNIDTNYRLNNSAILEDPIFSQIQTESHTQVNHSKIYGINTIGGYYLYFTEEVRDLRFGDKNYYRSKKIDNNSLKKIFGLKYDINHIDKKIYQNSFDVNSRFKIYYKYKIISDKDDRISHIFNKYNIQDLILNENIPNFEMLNFNSIDVLDYVETNNKINFKIKKDSYDRILLFNDNFNTSWIAKVNNIDVKIFRANHFAMGVHLPKNTEIDLLLYYKPWWSNLHRYTLITSYAFIISILMLTLIFSSSLVKRNAQNK